jgi:hypothetical protein
MILLARPARFSGPEFEIVDGQQRLATLAIVLATLSEHLSAGRETVHKILLWKQRSRLTLQSTNNADFLWLLKETAVLRKDDSDEQPANYGNRLIKKCHRFFEERIRARSTKSKKALYKRLLDSRFVAIQVRGEANAFTLFERLNYRGTPLKPSDIIKGHLLGVVGKRERDSYDKKWETAISALANKGDDRQSLIRFLRHYYNVELARRNVKRTERANSTNLVDLYIDLAKRRKGRLLEELAEGATSYRYLVHRESNRPTKQLESRLLDLSRIDGAPSYALLFYLYHHKGMAEGQLGKVVDYVVRFFARRHVCGEPGTQQLEGLFLDLIVEIEKRGMRGAPLLIAKTLMAASAPRDVFERELARLPIYLRGPLCKFLLKEAGNKGLGRDAPYHWDAPTYYWEAPRNPLTVEHVMPQTLNHEWRKQLGGSDSKAVYEKWIHRLGNLTLLVRQAEFGNKSFQYKKAEFKKMAPKESPLWADILKSDCWREREMDRRTKGLSKEIARLLAFPGER